MFSYVFVFLCVGIWSALVIILRRFPTESSLLQVDTRLWSITVRSSPNFAPLQITAKKYNSLLEWWFHLGSWLSVPLMAISASILVLNIINILKVFFKSAPVSAEGIDTPMLSVAIPGINLPMEDLPFLWLGVAISVFWHELGHFIAALLQGIPIRSIGVFLALGIPGAFVEIENGPELRSLSPFRRLQIYAAGVWHNVVICILVCVCISSLSTLLLPFYSYQSGGGPVVVGFGPRVDYGDLIRVGDQITHLDGVPVVGVLGFAAVLDRIAKSDARGWCVPPMIFGDQQGHSSRCCSIEEENEGQEDDGTYCFEYRAPLPSASSASILASSTSSVIQLCLAPRPLLARLPQDHQLRRCATTDDCSQATACLRAVLAQPNDTFVALTVKRAGGWQSGEESRVLLHPGSPRELLYLVSLTDFHLRSIWCKLAPLSLCIQLPFLIDRALRYVLAVSASVAFFNSLPLTFADGGLMLEEMLTILIAWPRAAKTSNSSGSQSFTPTTANNTASDTDVKIAASRLKVAFFCRVCIRTVEVLGMLNATIMLFQRTWTF